MEHDNRPWLDILERKHECGPSLAPYVTLDVPTEDGRGAPRLQLPERYGVPQRLEINAVFGSGPRIAVIGRLPPDDLIPEETAILMVAKQAEDGSFVAHVWHELFPRAFNYLGLADDQDENPL